MRLWIVQITPIDVDGPIGLLHSAPKTTFIGSIQLSTFHVHDDDRSYEEGSRALLIDSQWGRYEVSHGAENVPFNLSIKY